MLADIYCPVADFSSSNVAYSPLAIKPRRYKSLKNSTISGLDPSLCMEKGIATNSTNLLVLWD